MQTAASQTESESLNLSLCVHHYTLIAPCPKGQGICHCLLNAVRISFASSMVFTITRVCEARRVAVKEYSKGLINRPDEAGQQLC